MKGAAWALLSVLLCACTAVALAQEAKIAQGKADISKANAMLPDKEYTAKATDTSYTANGERVQRLEIVIPGVTAEQVWNAVSTSEGLRTFVAPVTEVEMKYNGHYYTNYQAGSKIGDPGTIYNTVVAYVPREMVAIHVKLNSIFPAPVVEADQLNAVLQITPVAAGGVRVSEAMVGWKSGEDWDKVYKFFETGNAYTLGQLYKALTVGPREWKRQ